jgi:hypothetical protein
MESSTQDRTTTDAETTDPVDGALDRAADGPESIRSASEDRQGDEDILLDYFLGNSPRPGQTGRLTLEAEAVDGKVWRCTVRALEWAEWKDCETRARDKETGEFDVFVYSSWVVARALISPVLGPMLDRIKNEKGPDNAPPDAAALLRRFFGMQSGSLIVMQRKVIEFSKLDEQGGGGVKEVEAGKTSP